MNFQLTEEQLSQLKDVFEKAIGNPSMKVEVESLGAEELPVTVTMEEWMRRMKDMSRVSGGIDFYGSLPDQYKVAVNANHPLVSRILGAEPDRRSAIARQAFDLALLAQGMLKGADLTRFVERSVSDLSN